MGHEEMDKLNRKIESLEKMSVVLANRLNEKIDECEELKTRYESVNSQFRDELAEHKVLSKECMRFEMALNRILDNHSDGDLVIEVSSEALYGDR